MVTIGREGREMICRYFRFFVCAILTPMLVYGCIHLYGGSIPGSSLKEANDLFSKGSYKASLVRYQQMMERYPEAGDRILFEMGIIYAYPSNEQKDYQKSLQCFRKILKEHPESRYRQDSAEMVSHIENVILKDKKIITLQKQLAVLEQEIKGRESEIIALQKRIETLERELKGRGPIVQDGPASKVLIEKSQRTLTLLSQDKVLKIYKIALGGNPKGPKERQGDNKTPEGTYVIDSRNRDSAYHLSLHISYPSEKDRKRARELGVSPGGDIMIHGLKNGFSWMGDLHRESDWTKGCIAVTDEEIEEIAALVPNGTAVEIRP
jgi:tetratricopeptide (TPR) repeat protein